jgi:hypothetical protein
MGLPRVTSQTVAVWIICVVLKGGLLLLLLGKIADMFMEAIGSPELLLFIPGTAAVVMVVGTAISGELATSAIVGLVAGVALYLIFLAF